MNLPKPGLFHFKPKVLVIDTEQNFIDPKVTKTVDKRATVYFQVKQAFYDGTVKL